MNTWGMRVEPRQLTENSYEVEVVSGHTGECLAHGHVRIRSDTVARLISDQDAVLEREYIAEVELWQPRQGDDSEDGKPYATAAVKGTVYWLPGNDTRWAKFATLKVLQAVPPAHS